MAEGKDVTEHVQETASIASAEMIPSAKTSEESILREIRLHQFKRIIESDQPLLAHRPFSLQAHLHFPIRPTKDNIDIDTTTYDVQVVAADLKNRNVIARNGVGKQLVFGINDYEDQIPMSGLAAGNYLIRIHTFAPFAKIEDSKDIEVTVVE